MEPVRLYPPAGSGEEGIVGKKSGSGSRTGARKEKHLSICLDPQRYPIETGSESRDGVTTVRIEGSVDGEAVADALGALGGEGLAGAASEGTVTVWIGADDLLPRRVEIDYDATVERERARGALAVDLEADLFDYGADVTIDAPENAQPLSLDDLPGLLGP